MIDYAYATSEGEREINEDSLKIVKKDENNYCFLLADGLGGHGLGDAASRTAVNNSEEIYLAYPEDENIISMLFESAQRRVLFEQEERRARSAMKTTLSVLTVSGKTARWGHIGDTRVYCFKPDGTYTRTLDHSVPQMLVDMGRISEDQIRYHPDRNRLLRVIGEEWSALSYQVAEPVELCSGTAFLLCSDGFWEHITENEMISALRPSASAEEWLEKMRSVVTANGKGRDADNYSAIAVKIL